jgi:hypothetical protein
MQETTNDKLACDCCGGTDTRPTDSDFGDRKCLNCGSVFTVVAPVAPAPAPAAVATDDDLKMLRMLLDEHGKAATREARNIYAESIAHRMSRVLARLAAAERQNAERAEKLTKANADLDDALELLSEAAPYIATSTAGFRRWHADRERLMGGGSSGS